jgi:8-oxo-dGTP pyrophosphatase MutT (NUDIX family)
MPAPNSNPWPEYCCVIIQDPAGRFLLEQRPADARAAPSALTNFGGSREPHEPPARCATRELREELGLHLPDSAVGLPVLVLRDGPRVVAWFYRIEIDPGTPLATEPGRAAIWLAPDRLRTAQLSPWHSAAMDAFLAGRPEANLPS